MRQLLFFLPLLVIAGAVGLYVGDKWLQRRTFAMEALTVGSIVQTAAFGLVGFATGVSVQQEALVLTTPLRLVAQLGTALLYGGILFGTIRAPGEGPGRLIWAGLSTYCAMAFFSQLVNPGPFELDLVFLMLTSYMLWRSAGTNLDDVVRIARWGLWTLVVASLIAATSPFGWAETGGSLIGLDWRLSGVSPHPNHLGPHLVMLLLLNVVRPPRGSWRAAEWAIPLVMLLLTQSKSSWGGALLGAGIIWWYRVGTDLVDRYRWLPTAMLGMTVAVVLLIFSTVPAQEFLTPEEAEEVLTFTGRSNIWGIGIDAFVENPVFGAGSDVYEQYALTSGQAWAGQAHNQVVQTMASEGVVGLLGLMIYALVLLFLGYRLGAVSGGVSMALVGAFLLRWVTETPAQTLTFEQILLVGLLVAWSREAPNAATLQYVSLGDLRQERGRHSAGVSLGRRRRRRPLRVNAGSVKAGQTQKIREPRPRQSVPDAPEETASAVAVGTQVPARIPLSPAPAERAGPMAEAPDEPDAGRATKEP